MPAVSGGAENDPVTAANEPRRCSWARTPLSIAYHDREWGVPVHDDTVFFEFLMLEGAQAGLSWETILRKREAYREAFAGFDPAQRRPIHPGTGRAAAARTKASCGTG